MIQDIGDHLYNNSYKPVPPDPDSFFLYYRDKKALAKKCGKEIDFLRARDFAAVNPDLYEHYTYLFSIDDDRFYLADEEHFPVTESFLTETGAEMVPVGSFRSAAPRYLAFAGITGHQLACWYDSRRFCGRCGAPMKPDTKERMMHCERCGLMEYPKICPAVIIGVTDGDRLLLTKYAGRDYTNYALVAGFCEIGETLEQTVRREVKEELGLSVTNIRYYKSQPWSFSDTLLSGFFCDLAKQESVRLEKDELSLAEWFDREDLPVSDREKASLTQEMITAFHEGKV